MLLDNFIKNKIHKRGFLLNEVSSEELTIEFLNDMTEARIIITDEENQKPNHLQKTSFRSIDYYNVNLESNS